MKPNQTKQNKIRKKKTTTEINQIYTKNQQQSLSFSLAQLARSFFERELKNVFYENTRRRKIQKIKAITNLFLICADTLSAMEQDKYYNISIYEPRVFFFKKKT